ncbi:MAG TPA: nucleotidyltransferase [bacterium]
MLNKLIEALEEAIDFLEKNNYRYVVIGGLANTFWGIARATHDIDLKVLIEEGKYQEFKEKAYSKFETRKLPVQSPLIVAVIASNSVGIDFLLSVPGYEVNTFERAVRHQINNLQIWLCSPEDLIIHKAIANRDKDWVDIEGVLIEQVKKIDIEYVEKWLSQFADALEKPEILNRFLMLFKQIVSSA